MDNPLLFSPLRPSIKAATLPQSLLPAAGLDKQVQHNISQVARQLSHARHLRKHRTSLLTTAEKHTLDDTFARADHAIQHLTALTERAQLDMKRLSSLGARHTVEAQLFRDSPGFHDALSSLTLAAHDLTTATLMLANRDTLPSTTKPTTITSSVSPSPPTYSALPYSPPLSDTTLPISVKRPPMFKENPFFADNRRKNLQRRASAQASDLREMGSRSKSTSCLPSHVPEVPESTAELEGTEPERSFSRTVSGHVPSIRVSSTSNPKAKRDDNADPLDFHLFQNAIGSMPPFLENTFSTSPEHARNSTDDLDVYELWTPPLSAPLPTPPELPHSNTSVHHQSPSARSTSTPPTPSNIPARQPSRPQLPNTIESQSDDLCIPNPHRSSLPTFSQSKAHELPNTAEPQTEKIVLQTRHTLPVPSTPSSTASTSSPRRHQYYYHHPPPPSTSTTSTSITTHSNQRTSLPTPNPTATATREGPSTTFPQATPFSPAPTDNGTNTSERERQESLQPYFDWYSPHSFSSHFSSAPISKRGQEPWSGSGGGGGVKG